MSALEQRLLLEPGMRKMAMAEKHPVVLSEEDLEKVTGGLSSTSGGLSGIGDGDLSGMDLETALMMVQAQRAQLLDDQLRQQAQEVQARNEQVSRLQDLHDALSNARDGLNDGSAGAEGHVSLDARIDPDDPNSPTYAELFEAAGFTDDGDTNDDGNLDAEELSSAIETVRGAIDSERSQHHMDMLRLQSQDNKRNEAYDLMNDYIKKMQDNRANIINNMR
ncbi:hypothetical protein [Aquibaculum arenosum]|uniref:EF-hand domain-containing protein n=1 Tax=Aquibaculum arenosum TaxID=3032591 RepID=A0ABT5YMC4_9PROT|nr:hypothetical protein [Fodinicurvata sp. CAU 1616]MDF2096111.1 hypothetical protein [Fodinicurvata sp. CAU 1616]